MMKKYGKFYADWADAKGKRRRKAFNTKREAKAFTADQRKAIASKKTRRRA